MSAEMLQYQSWESNTLREYSTLLDKYNSHKEKETAIADQTECKNSKKDTLLKFKADNTLSKMGNLELDNIEREEMINSNYNRNIRVIEEKRQRIIEEAEKEYERTVSIAREKQNKKVEESKTIYENSLSYYEKEQEASISKCKREYDSKKRILEARGEQVEQLRTITLKTATEISMEKAKYDILSKMNDILARIEMSRSQIKGTFSNTIPSLPEPFTKKIGVAAPRQSIETIGEDASLAILREEARREDAYRRREAHEMEMEKQEKAFQYRRQLEIEAQERKKANEEYRRSETIIQTQSSNDTIIDDKDDDGFSMTSQEMEEYITAKKSLKK